MDDDLSGVDIAGMSEQIGKDLFGDEQVADPVGSPAVAAPSPTPAEKPLVVPSETNPNTNAAPAPIAATPAVSGEIPAAPAPIDPTVSAPKSWKPEVAATWNALPVEVRAEIARRESDFHNGLTQYKEAAGFGKQVQQVLAPFMQTLQYYKIDPMQQINSLMRAHHTLALGTPAEKQAMLRQMDRDYNLGLGQSAAAPDQGPYLDPAVQALQERLGGLESQQRSEQIARFNQQQIEIQRKVETFAKDPKNAYFDECAAQIEFNVKGGMSLEDAYQHAIWQNPTTRAKEIERLAKETASSRESAERSAAQAAAKAAAKNKRPADKGVHPTVKPGSIDDTLQKTLADIKARSH